MKISIVFTFDSKFCVPAYIAISSLIDSANETTQYDIIIYHWGISDSKLNYFKKLIMPTRHSISLYKAKAEDFEGFPITYTWSYSVYLRLMLPKILADREKVIYSDVDVLFKGDLSEVYCTDITNVEWAGVRAEKNGRENQNHQFYEEYQHEYIYWSGFLLMNLNKMREERFSEKIRDCVKKYRQRLKMFDLEVLNLISNEIYDLPLRYVMLQSIYNTAEIQNIEEFDYINSVYSIDEMKEEKKKTVIIHYAGKPGKPWLLKNIPDYYRVYVGKLPYYFKIQNFICRIENWIVCRLRNLKGKIGKKKQDDKKY